MGVDKQEIKADYTSPVVLTAMIDNKHKPVNHGVFEKTDFDKNRNYFHIQPHDESHGIRRKAIMAKYGPQIKELMNKDPRSALVALGVTVVQLTIAAHISEYSWLVYFAVMWIVGATLNHSGQIMIHELTHYTAFEGFLWNRLSAIMVTIPTCLPSAITFGKYHYEHHVNMGNPDYDADLPTKWEIGLFQSPLAKVFFIFCHPLFYALRPLFTKPKAPTMWEGINWVIVITTNILIYKYWGPAAFFYLLGSTWFSMGLHPTAAHTIGEHYEFVKGQESYNYYGFWNFWNVNLGYHIEHHDFPNMTCWNLPKVAKIAPEFYEGIPYHTSHCKIMWNYVMDKNIGAFSRIDITENEVKKSK